MVEKMPPPKKMKVLTEQEIQERLYGFYHKTDMVGEPRLKPAATPEAVVMTQVPETPIAVAPAAELFGRTETQPQLPRDRTFSSTSKANERWSWRGKVNEWIQAAGVLFKKIQPQYLLAAGGILLGVVVVFQLAAFGIKKMNSRSLPASPALEEQTPERREPVRRVIQRIAVPADGPVNPAPPVPPVSTTEKVYTVQLCLSDNLQASEGLIQTLEGKGYEAYYRKIRGSRGNDLYQIFVGRFPSSSEAQTALKRLRQDEAFKS
jgi:cell division septation protein DedD